MNLVAEGSVAVTSGLTVADAAAGILDRVHPSVRELWAARQQNQEVHGGTTPAASHPALPVGPTPEWLPDHRRAIDAILQETQRRLAELA